MENYYKYNSVSIVCRKSKKYSDSDAIMINHLEDGEVSDERILQQLINAAEKVTFYCKEYNNICLSVDLNICKRYQYNGFWGTEHSRFYNPNVKFYRVEKLIHYLFNLFSLIYPYNTLSSTAVFEDESIRRIIKEYNNK